MSPPASSRPSRVRRPLPRKVAPTGRRAARPRPAARASARPAKGPTARKASAPRGASGPAEVRRGLEVLEELLELVKGRADARYYLDRWTTLRCANSRLYQPHAEELEGLSLRVATDDDRIGIATTTDLGPEGLSALVEQATSLARVAPPTPGFPGFPGPNSDQTPAIPFSTRVLQEDLVGLGGKLSEAFSLINDALGPARISGVYNQGLSVVAVANTSDLRRGYRRSAAQASLLAELPNQDPPVSGWAEGAHWDPAQLRLSSLAREAVAATPRTPVQSVAPGKHRVLLMGPAVSELTNFLSFLGLGATSVEEGWSFLVEGRGKRLVAPQMDLCDDPLNPRGLPSAVDYEGLPHRARPVFDGGKAMGPAHDTLSAARARVESTHNAVPPEAPFGELGPVPRHLAMKAGDASPEELLQELGRGILVTRFWYVRAVHPGKTLLTGMTRDGTYWVDRGEIQYPIRNLRFTESILGTFAGVEAVGKALRCYSDERGFFCPVLAPIVSRSFTFTSATTF